ncbi:hypothetical protein KJ671_00815 [Patescibacteria group bacterium]|nr:hypothetical protein [Patescibacteria group bacterium]
MNKDIRFLANIFLVFLFGLLQSFSLISFLGTKPNLLLSLLIVLLFTVKNFWQYLILILTALISLNYSALITKETAIFGIIMLLAFYFKKYLTEHFFLISFFLAIILTTLFYLFIDYQFIFNNLNIFLLELIFNALLTIFFGLLYYQVLSEKQR